MCSVWGVRKTCHVRNGGKECMLWMCYTLNIWYRLCMYRPQTTPPQGKDEDIRDAQHYEHIPNNEPPYSTLNLNLLGGHTRSPQWVSHTVNGWRARALQFVHTYRKCGQHHTLHCTNPHTTWPSENYSADFAQNYSASVRSRAMISNHFWGGPRWKHK